MSYTLYWTVYGKIWEIVKYNGDTIKFHYGPDGNRIAKEVFVDSLHKWTGTYYVHDATGNIMATYQWINRDTFNLDELVMYGSSRLGTYGVNHYLTDTATRDSAWCAEHDTSTNPFTDSVTYFTAGLKQYEFTNHLGNVLLTLTDRHIPFYFGGVSYIAEVASAQDYYPFGMEMVGRAYNPALYRFGFNGKEDINEIEGIGNSIDFGARIHDPRLGRFLSVDPLFRSYAWNSPYTYAENRVIDGIDLGGRGWGDYLDKVVEWGYETYQKVATSVSTAYNAASTAVDNKWNKLDNKLYDKIQQIKKSPTGQAISKTNQKYDAIKANISVKSPVKATKITLVDYRFENDYDKNGNVTPNDEFKYVGQGGSEKLTTEVETKAGTYSKEQQQNESNPSENKTANEVSVGKTLKRGDSEGKGSANISVETDNEGNKVVDLNLKLGVSYDFGIFSINFSVQSGYKTPDIKKSNEKPANTGTKKTAASATNVSE